VVPDEAVTVDLPKSFSVTLSTSAYKALTLSSHTLGSYAAAVGSGLTNNSIVQVGVAAAAVVVVEAAAVVVVAAAASARILVVVLVVEAVVVVEAAVVEAAVVLAAVVLAAVVLAAVVLAAVVVVVAALAGAGAGRYLDGVPQYPPKASTTLFLARVKPLARAQAILKTTSLFLIASIYFEKVYLRETTLPPLSLDVTLAAGEL